MHLLMHLWLIFKRNGDQVVGTDRNCQARPARPATEWTCHALALAPCASELFAWLLIWAHLFTWCTTCMLVQYRLVVERYLHAAQLKKFCCKEKTVDETGKEKGARLTNLKLENIWTRSLWKVGMIDLSVWCACLASYCNCFHRISRLWGQLPVQWQWFMSFGSPEYAWAELERTLENIPDMPKNVKWIRRGLLFQDFSTEMKLMFYKEVWAIGESYSP